MEQGATIYLVDELVSSVDLAIERFNSVLSKALKSHFEIKVRKINEIETDIDIAIISTSSQVRAKVTQELLVNNKVQYILFEKFLFQNRKDYSEIQIILKQKKVKAWVNQWMSSSVAFNEMAAWVGDGLKEISVDGKGWGLACNSVHFLDFLDSISGREGLKINKIDINNECFESKRSGFFELTGGISIQSARGIILNLSSKGIDSDNVIHIKMDGGNKCLEATLSIGEINCVFHAEDDEVSIKKYTLPMQSRITGGIVENICQNDTCTLPTYDQSIKHHLILFDCFSDVFKGNLGLADNCPIT